MLRITVLENKDHPEYVLEGRLVGDWVQELVWVARDVCPATKAVIDIENVHYVDSLGEKALHWLNGLGAAFVAQNAYGVHLCERLELRRLTVAENGIQNHKGRNKELNLLGRSRSPRRHSSNEKSPQ